MAAYGFVAGLPLPLSGFTLRLWLSEGGVSLAVIGLTANIGLAYSLKFLWAPLLDQAPPPGPLRRFGRRRGWLLAIQPALVLAPRCCSRCPTRPPRRLRSLAAAALVAFLSASQDIVVDAWRIETFPARLQGAAMAAYVWGYRVALLIATTGVIGAAGIDRLACRVAVRGRADRAGRPGRRCWRRSRSPRPSARSAGFAARMRHAVLEPLAEFLSPGRARGSSSASSRCSSWARRWPGS